MNQPKRTSTRLAVVAILALAICLPATAFTQTFDAERYADIVTRSDGLYDRAQELDPADPERIDLLRQSTDLKESAIDMLRNALRAGELDEYGEGPKLDLLNLYQNTIVLLSEVGSCDAAEYRLRWALDDASILPDGAVEELSQLTARVEACERPAVEPLATAEPTEPVAETTEPVAETTETTEPAEADEGEPQEVARADEPAASDLVGQEPDEVSEEGGESNLAAILLIGAGGALMASALTYDIILSGDRDEFKDIQAACATGPCDYDRGTELQGSLDSAKVVIGVLLGAGVASATAGTILLLTGSDDEAEEDSVAVSPILGPGSYGAGLTVSF
jgi:hypothetical protein